MICKDICIRRLIIYSMFSRNDTATNDQIQPLELLSFILKAVHSNPDIGYRIEICYATKLNYIHNLTSKIPLKIL
jgi:hypothetical protein